MAEFIGIGSRCYCLAGTSQQACFSIAIALLSGARAPPGANRHCFNLYLTDVFDKSTECQKRWLVNVIASQQGKTTSRVNDHIKATPMDGHLTHMSWILDCPSSSVPWSILIPNQINPMIFLYLLVPASLLECWWASLMWCFYSNPFCFVCCYFNQSFVLACSTLFFGQGRVVVPCWTSCSFFSRQTVPVRTLSATAFLQLS